MCKTHAGEKVHRGLQALFERASKDALRARPQPRALIRCGLIGRALRIWDGTDLGAKALSVN
jgi:hypothetical protein